MLTPVIMATVRRSLCKPHNSRDREGQAEQHHTILSRRKSPLNRFGHAALT